MDDVLQPRSRHSWDVLKAWFRVGLNDIGNGVTEDSSKPAGPRRPPDSQEEGEIVAAAAAADVYAARSEKQRNEEPSDNVDANVGKRGGEEGAKQETVPAAATTPAAEAAAAVVTPAVATAEAGQPAESTATQAEAATPARTAAHEAAADDAVVGNPVGPSGDSNDTTAASKGSPSAAGSCGGGGGWNVVECKVGADGTCENCGEVLRSVDLSKADEERLLHQVGAVRCGVASYLSKGVDWFKIWVGHRPRVGMYFD